MFFIERARSYFILLILFVIFSTGLLAQELFVSSEPASTMPARSFLIKQGYTNMSGSQKVNNFNTQLQFGLAKKWMVHFESNFKSLEWYTQYRVYSKDAMYEHLRMALFFKAIYSNSSAIQTNSILLEGQESVIHSGLIITQLKHKWASSLSLGALMKQEALASNGKAGLQYSFSNGLLVYPKSYSSYGQTNMNLYIELIGQTLFSGKANYLDAAPAIQFIFNSQSKLNVSYRFPLVNQTNRATYNNASISWDYLFFNLIPKRKRKV